DVVSAEESIFSGDAELVSLPGQSGELGILPGHVPLITLIRPGFVRIHLPGKQEVEQVFVAGGVLEVQPDMVTVLADTAVRSKDLDEAKAAKALEDARALRQKATGELEIAKLEAEMAALAAELVAIKKIRQR
ncbi:MAG: F0F1 ATP synthase subunit epsilon, partial [Sutterella sp.]|nr:F0F1 ATP synthase subunit epsilon [Sutterella sp.]